MMTSLRWTSSTRARARSRCAGSSTPGTPAATPPQVQQHVDELAELGVPAPDERADALPAEPPARAPGPTSSRCRTAARPARRSGRWSWASSPDDLLVAAACDHTDRDLEVHGVAWSKQSAPDIIGDLAWRWDGVADRFDDFTLRAWVTHDDERGADLRRLAGRAAAPRRTGSSGWTRPACCAPARVLLSGTIPMIEGVDQFADGLAGRAGRPGRQHQYGGLPGRPAQRTLGVISRARRGPRGRAAATWPGSPWRTTRPPR